MRVKTSCAKMERGDVVLVKSERSKYAGKLGVVQGFTRSRKSVYVTFEGGQEATLRVGSLEVKIDRNAAKPPTDGGLASEIRELREEVKKMRQLLLRFEKLVLGDEREHSITVKWEDGMVTEEPFADVVGIR